MQAKNFEKIKPYGDTDVTSQFETHYQNLQVCFKWETKIMLKQLFKKVQVGKDQEKAQSEKDSHSKNRGGK